MIQRKHWKKMERRWHTVYIRWSCPERRDDSSDGGRDLRTVHRIVAVWAGMPRWRALCREEHPILSLEGEFKLLPGTWLLLSFPGRQRGGTGRKKWWRTLVWFELVKEVKNWSLCQGRKRLGHVERNEPLKQLGWTGQERGVPGNSEAEVTPWLYRWQTSVPTPKIFCSRRERRRRKGGGEG